MFDHPNKKISMHHNGLLGANMCRNGYILQTTIYQNQFAIVAELGFQTM